jgi:Fe-S cluster assembly ATPase SufC
MEKSLDVEVHEHWSGIKLLSLLVGIMPVMEAIDRLRKVVRRRTKTEKKYENDIKYWRHEAEMIELQHKLTTRLMNERLSGAKNK